jgi:hypothetical protein
MGRYVRAAEGLLVVVAVAASACSGDDGNDRGDFVAALTGPADEAANEEENRCIAEKIVDVVGVDALEEADIIDKIEDDPDAPLADYGVELDEEQTATLSEDMGECVDLRAFLAQELTSGPEPLTPEDAECFVDGLDDATLGRAFVVAIAEGDAAVENDAKLTAAFEESALACQPGASS